VFASHKVRIFGFKIGETQCHAKTMMSRKPFVHSGSAKIITQARALSLGRTRRKNLARRGVERPERMNRARGIKDRHERSEGNR
jgi:hypothetical protein